MASHNFAPVRALDREIVQLFCKATGAGAAALTSLSSRCGVSSIAQTATGKYTVTLDAKYQELRACLGTVIDPAAGSPDDWSVTVEADLVANAATFGIAIWKGGAAADLTTDEKLMLMIVLKNTSR